MEEDLESFGVTAHIQITNPARPERGTVRVSDLADIECRDSSAPCTATLADTIIFVLCDGISTRTA